MACSPQNYPVGVEKCKAKPVFICDVAENTLIVNSSLGAIRMIQRHTATDPNNPNDVFWLVTLIDGTQVWLDENGDIIATPTPPVDNEIIPQRAMGGIRPMYENINGQIAGTIWSMPSAASYLIPRIIIEVINVNALGTLPTLDTPHGTFNLLEDQRLEFITTSREESLSESFFITTGDAADIIGIHWTENDRP